MLQLTRMLHGDAESIRIEDPTIAKVEFVVKCPAVLRDSAPGQTPGGQIRNPPPGTTNTCSLSLDLLPDSKVDLSEADILGTIPRPDEPPYDGSAVLVWRCFRTLRWPSPLQD